MEEVRKLFRQQAPSKDIVGMFKEVPSWVDEEVQDKFVEMVLCDDVALKYKAVEKYPWLVCKAIVREVEAAGGGISDWLMEKCIDLQPKGEEVSDSLGGMGRDLTYSYKSYEIENVTFGIRVWPQFSHVGLALWPAGFAVAEWVLRNKTNLNGKTIVELGSGVGLTGIVASLATAAKRSIMTDYLPMVNDNAEINIKEANVGDKTQVDLLDWMSVAKNDPAVLSLIESYNTTHLLAADVVYDREVVPALADTFRAFLRLSPNLEKVVFAVTRRNEETFQYLLEQLRRCNLTLTATSTPSPTGVFHYDPDLITIYSLELKDD